MVRIHNRALTDAEIKANYAALQNDKALPQDKSLIFNQDRRDLSGAGKEIALDGVEKAAAPDNAWVLPAKKAVSFSNIPDWGKDGFALEVYCKVDKLPSGYAVLMRDSFGYPKFAGKKDITIGICYIPFC